MEILGLEEGAGKELKQLVIWIGMETLAADILEQHLDSVEEWAK